MVANAPGSQLDPKYVPALQTGLTKARRAIAARSPAAFAHVYLVSLFQRTGCRLHDEVFGKLAHFHERRGSHLAVAAPRGHAKSTIVSLAYVLWCLLHKKEPFVLLVSASAEQATKLLDHVKRQLESNQLLRTDFPELEGVTRISPWRKNTILLPNGAMLACYCAGQNLRGARHGKDRPTLIVADDLEDKLQVGVEEQRGKLSDWFYSTLLKAGSPDTNVVVAGTVLHHQSLLATLLDEALTPGWERLRFQAIEENPTDPNLWEQWSEIFRGRAKFEEATGRDAAKAFFDAHKEELEAGSKVLWPDMYPLEVLMEIKLREGTSSFEAEYQNQPLDPERCLFASAKFEYWDGKFHSPDRLLESLGRDGDFYGACDPGLGNDLTKGDYSAIVFVYVPRKSKIKYVVAADLARRTPSATIERILELLKIYPAYRFVVEANQFQQLMVDQLRTRAKEMGRRINVIALHNTVAKRQRIASLDAEISQGLVVFCRSHQLLMDQLRNFPMAQHDDGPDALQMAVAEATGCNSWLRAARETKGTAQVVYGRPLVRSFD